MKILCEQCGEKNKGFYSTFWYEEKWITLCDDCRYGKNIPRNGKHPDEVFDSLQIPFWKLMGQKPKPKDIAYEKYLKRRNMTYGDAVRERNLAATNPSVIGKFEKHRNEVR